MRDYRQSLETYFALFALVLLHIQGDNRFRRFAGSKTEVAWRDEACRVRPQVEGLVKVVD